MPVLEITFPAGRYHATAWGRNVNEGDPEWPPSPFRLARALMDMRYRRFEGISDSELEAAPAAGRHAPFQPATRQQDGREVLS